MAGEGWTRWLTEMYEFEFTNVYNADVLAGGLRDRYDVILMADMSSRQIMEGFARGAVPPRYEGGLGAAGVREASVAGAGFVNFWLEAGTEAAGLGRLACGDAERRSPLVRGVGELAELAGDEVCGLLTDVDGVVSDPLEAA